MSTINFDTSNRTTGGLQRFDCLAWVNFNGTGTVAIRASGNVSSITDNGTGDYTINFTNALPDANYGFHVNANSPGGSSNTVIAPLASAPTASAFRLGTYNTSFGAADASYVSATFFR